MPAARSKRRAKKSRNGRKTQRRTNSNGGGWFGSKDKAFWKQFNTNPRTCFRGNDRSTYLIKLGKCKALPAYKNKWKERCNILEAIENEQAVCQNSTPGTTAAGPPQVESIQKANPLSRWPSIYGRLQDNTYCMQPKNLEDIKHFNSKCLSSDDENWKRRHKRICNEVGQMINNQQQKLNNGNCVRNNNLVNYQPQRRVQDLISVGKTLPPPISKKEIPPSPMDVIKQEEELDLNTLYKKSSQNECLDSRTLSEIQKLNDQCLKNPPSSHDISGMWKCDQVSSIKKKQDEMNGFTGKCFAKKDEESKENLDFLNMIDNQMGMNLPCFQGNDRNLYNVNLIRCSNDLRYNVKHANSCYKIKNMSRFQSNCNQPYKR